jgi:hypothetical protein
MARDAHNGVASDHYSRSARNSPRTSNTEPLSASPYGDEDAQFQARIGPHPHHNLRRCRREAPTARPNLCFRLSVHAFHCLALDATTLALHHRRSASTLPPNSRVTPLGPARPSRPSWGRAAVSPAAKAAASAWVWAGALDQGWGEGWGCLTERG